MIPGSLHHALLRQLSGIVVPSLVSLPTAISNYVRSLFKADDTSIASTVVSNFNVIDKARNRLLTVPYAYNAVTQSSFSPFSPYWSAYFPLTSYLTLPTSTDFDFLTADFTLETWVKYDNNLSEVNRYVIHGDSATASGSYALGKITGRSGKFGFMVFQNSTTVPLLEDPTIPTAEWIHYAVVRSGNNWTLYKNGTSVATATYNATVSRPASNVFVGTAGNLLTTGNTVGNIADLRIVKGTAVYTGNFTPPAAKLEVISGTVCLLFQKNTWADLANPSRTFTITGYPQLTSHSPFTTAGVDPLTNGGSLTFTNSTDYLQCSSSGDLTLPGDFTVEWYQYLLSAWTAGGGPGIGQKQNDTSGGWAIYRDTTSAPDRMSLRIAGEAGAGNAQIYSNDTPQIGQWEHWAIVRQGTTIKFYVNGKESGSWTGMAQIAGNSKPLTLTTALKFYIGRVQHTTANAQYNIHLSNIKITKGRAVYTAPFSSPTSPLSVDSDTVLLVDGDNCALRDITGKTTLNNPSDWATYPVLTSKIKKFNTHSLAFNTNAAISVKYNNGLNFDKGDFCIDFQMYFDSFPSTYNYSILGSTNFRNGGTAQNVSIAALSNTAGAAGLYVCLGASPVINSVMNAIYEKTWYHVAIIKSAGQVKLFINGVQAGSTYNDTANTRIFAFYTSPSASNFGCIGGINNTLTNSFSIPTTANMADGLYLDDIRITKGVTRFNFNGFSAPTVAAGTDSASDPLFKYVSMLIQGKPLTRAVKKSSKIFYDKSTNNVPISSNPTNAAHQAVGKASFGPFSTQGWYWDCNPVASDTYNTTVRMTNNPSYAIGTGPFTIEMWINPKSASGTIFADANTAGIIIGWESATSFGRANQGSWSTNVNKSANMPQVGKWSHLAIVREGTGANQEKIYIDGTLVCTGTNASNYTTTQFDIGNQSGHKIASLKVNRSAIYTSNFVPSKNYVLPDGNTILLTANSNTIKDMSPVNNTLTLTAGYVNCDTGGPVNGTGSETSTSVTNPVGAAALSIPFGDCFIPKTQDFTVEFWVFAPFANIEGTIFGSSGTLKNMFDIYVDTNRAVNIRYGNDAGTVTNIVTAPATHYLKGGCWNHVIFSKTGTSTGLYINGTRAVLSGSDSRNYKGHLDLKNAVLCGPFTGGGFMISDFRFSKGIGRATLGIATYPIPTAKLTADAYTTFLLDTDGSNIVDEMGRSRFTSFGNTLNSLSSRTAEYPALTVDGGGAGSAITNEDNVGIETYNGDFTIDAWVKLNSYGKNIIVGGRNGYAYQVRYGFGILDKTNAHAGTNAAPSYGAEDKGLSFIFSPCYGYGGNVYYTKQVPALNTWTHVAVVRENGQMRMYMNGVRGTLYNDNALASTQSKLIESGPNGVVQIGGQIGDFDGFITGGNASAWAAGFDGDISEFRSINGQAIYSTNFNPESKTYLVPPASASTSYTGAIFSKHTLGVPANFALGTSNFTLEAWVNYNNAGDIVDGPLLTTHNSFVSGNSYLRFGKHNGIFKVWISNIDATNPICQDSVTTPTGWNHYALVRVGSVFTLYKNGASIATKSSGASLLAPLAYWIGTNGEQEGSPSSLLNGQIRNLRLTKSAVYTGAFTPPDRTVDFVPSINDLLLVATRNDTDNKAINAPTLVKDVSFGGNITHINL